MSQAVVVVVVVRCSGQSWRGSMTEQIRQMEENQGMSVTVQLNATVNMTIPDRTLLRLKLDEGREVVLVCGKGQQHKAGSRSFERND